MKQIIEAIQARLADLDMPIPYADATEHPFPRVLLWGSPGLLDSEPQLAPDGSYEDILGVTVAHTTGINVLNLVPKVRTRLDNWHAKVGDVHFELHLRYSQPIKPDNDVTLRDTNTHPCFAVDQYQLIVHPA